MTDSRTQVLPWFSCRDWNACSEQPGTGEQYRSDTVSWSCWVYIWHARVRRANEAPHVAAASGRGRTSGYHWPHELPRLTPVVACWWLPLEPRRWLDHKFSSQVDYSLSCNNSGQGVQRHAPVTQQYNLVLKVSIWQGNWLGRFMMVCWL